MRYAFENLTVWKESLKLSISIYKITKQFPKEELYGLTSQIRRAVISISSNIAEGSSKSSLKDQTRFSEISYGSLMEVLNQIILSYNLQYIDYKNYEEIRTQIEYIARLLSGYRKSQIERGKV